jgi:hypothetical protein
MMFALECPAVGEGGARAGRTPGTEDVLGLIGITSGMLGARTAAEVLGRAAPGVPDSV